jgi:hypothetical protein
MSWYMDFRRSVFILISALATPVAVIASASVSTAAFAFVSTPASTSAAPWSVDDGLTICSDLDFQGLQWPDTVPVAMRDPFAAGLNISGSFEGPDGWANLTDNFDGQGISMGLLNQNLGQGSLQPMWIEMGDGTCRR